jgi:prepilin-type N-terminal cleavage/methylation domain-containing protein
MARFTIKTQSGFTLVEVIIALGLASVVALGVASIMEQMGAANRHAGVVSSARLLKQNFIEMLSNDLAWQYTLLDPANKTFQCLISATDCTGLPASGGPAGFVVRNSANAVFYDGLTAARGFTENGADCTGFPSAGCPFHLQLSWTPLCAPKIPCVLPEIQVNGTLVFNSPSFKTAYNPENYSFKLFRKPLMQTALILPSNGATPSPSDPLQGVMTSMCITLKESSDPAGTLKQVANQLKASGLNDQQTSAYIAQIQQACK